MLALPWPIVQPEIVVCQAGNPAMAGCIQLGGSEYIHEQIIIGVHVEGWPIQVFMELLDHCPLEGAEIPACELGNGTQPYSSFYWHMQSLLQCHPSWFGRGTAPKPVPQVSVWSLKGLVKSAYARIGAMVHRVFRSSKAFWHLLSHFMAAFFLPTFSPNVSSCRGRATSTYLGMNLQ